MLKIFVAIIGAVLSVIGFYSVLRAFAERFFASESIRLSIFVQSEKDMRDIESAVVESIGGAIRMRSQRLAILLSEEYADDVHVIEIAQKYVADRYVIKRID